MLFPAKAAAELLHYTTVSVGGQTAWHIAAKEGHADVLRSMAEAIRAMDPQQLKLLSKYGSAADAIIRTMAGEQDSKMLTPLHLACIKGHAEAAQVLMSHGINPFAMVSRTATRCLGPR